MSPQDLITKAKAGLLYDAPFFASIAVRLPVVEDTKCDTMYVDGCVIGYNPEFVSSLTLSEIKGVIAHEVMHVACCHHTRRNNREHKKWNVACDHAINEILLSSGFVLPKGALTGYGMDKSAEQIYSMLPDEPETESSGEGQGEGDGSGFGEVRDLPGGSGAASPAELANAESEVKVMVAQAAQQAKAMGSLPEAISRMVDELLNPCVDWSELLKRFIQDSSKNDYSWMPPNKRFIHAGLYLPSLKSDKLSDVVIAVDTSGSIDDELLSQFSAEISSILSEFDTNITVIYCDAKISNVENFTSQDLPIKLNAIGGGGTSFKPPFAYVDDNDLKPVCLIYLTDLECSDFPQEPEYPVLWVNYGAERTVPFGSVITLNK